jgi:hypothetical protein
MNNIFENFKSEALFSAENPFFKSAQKTHTLFAEAFDKTARMQLVFGDELLDLNKKRFASLYAGASVQDTVANHQELMTEAGSRASALADEFQQVATDLQAGITDAANEWINIATETVNNATETAKPTRVAKVSKKAA